MKKILIAEDDKDVGKMLERAFILSGFKVDLVADGVSALNNLHKSDSLPDAIMMDVVMPEMSGLDLLMKIKQEPYLKNIPVIILTNSFLRENVKQFLALGADDYLIKLDNKPNDIIKKVNKLIESKNIISK
jgi:CheY-like chemotaxis protein